MDKHYYFMGMDLDQLLHSGIKQLLDDYDLTQCVLCIEPDRLECKRAELLIEKDYWYAFTIHNGKRAFAIDKINENNQHILREFVLNTETHLWNKVHERIVTFPIDYVKLHA
jgi:hypothetical protein